MPWGLYAMVGEWNFYHVGNDVTKIPDEHWYMTDYYRARETYYTMPQYPLTAVNVTADSYVQGDLEDWIDGALKLNGKDQYAFGECGQRPDCWHEGRRLPPSAAQMKTVDVHNSSFILEIYFKTEPGAKKAVLIRKMDDQAGYALTVDGAVTFAARPAARTSPSPERPQ